MGNHVGTAITLLVLGLTSQVAAAQDIGDARRGKAFAERMCAECHAIEPGAARHATTGIASFTEIARTPGMTALALAVWFDTPHPNMPNLVLAAPDRDNVIAYIMSLKSPQ